MIVDELSGVAAREEGIETVTKSSGEWMDDAFASVDAMEFSGEITGEDIRIALKNQGFPQPHHPNAWGALIRKLISANILTPTDKFVKAKIATSHARDVRVYYFKMRPSHQTHTFQLTAEEASWINVLVDCVDDIHGLGDRLTRFVSEHGGE